MEMSKQLKANRSLAERSLLLVGCILAVATIAAVVNGSSTPLPFASNSQEKPPSTASTSVIQCKEKSFPNLPGQNAFSLKKERNGTFTAVTESYGKPKTYPYLKCRFHSKDRNVFYCESESWAARGERVQSSSLGSDGSEALFDGYLFEVVKYPNGDDPAAVFSVRFDTDKCGVLK